MLVDSLALRLRLRTPNEASDLGARLCQSAAPAVYRCYLMAALPVAVLSIGSYEIATWLPAMVIWWSKPWLDRTIVFVLSRAAFGQSTTTADLWRAQRQVWWSQLLFTWTIRRLSPWRSLTQPVYQLEGLSIWNAGPRVRQIKQRTTMSALMMTQTFAFAEMALSMSLFSLVFWLAPAGQAPDLLAALQGSDAGVLAFAGPIAYAISVAFLEPFYAAAGFAMYLNRRAELEAWDIEQELRREFVR